MKLSVTKREYNWIMSGLYLAYKYEESLISAFNNCPKEAAKAKRRVDTYRKLRTALYERACS
jgi:uncharacterized protein YcgI (DUF1989 family)